jgi:hypothetical protein
LQDFAVAQPQISGYASTHVNDLSHPAQRVEKDKVKPEKAYSQPEQGL